MTWQGHASLHLHAPSLTNRGQQQGREAASLDGKIACACSASSVAHLSLAVLLQLSKGSWVQSATLSPLIASLLCFVESAGRRRLSGTGLCKQTLYPHGRQCNAQESQHVGPARTPNALPKDNCSMTILMGA